MFRNRLICDCDDKMLGSAARFGCVFLRCGQSRRLLSKASGSDGGRKGVVMTESFADNGEHYHLTPMGEGDASQRTTMTALSAQMTERNETCVVGFSKFGFRMSDKSFLYGPIATFPKLTLSWRVRTLIISELFCFFCLLVLLLNYTIVRIFLIITRNPSNTLQLNVARCQNPEFIVLSITTSHDLNQFLLTFHNDI
jgi:hypothetical protein